MTVTNFILAFSAIVVLLAVVIALFSMLAVSIYRYGEENGVAKTMPINDLFLGMGMPFLPIGDGVFVAEEMDTYELESFLEEATDHPELYIDGEKIEKDVGLIYIDFGNTSFNSGGDSDK